MVAEEGALVNWQNKPFKKKLTLKWKLEMEAPASNVSWLVDIFWQLKYKRKYSEIKYAVCIVTSNVAIVATVLYLCRHGEWYKYRTSICYNIPMMYWCLTTLSSYASCIFLQILLSLSFSFLSLSLSLSLSFLLMYLICRFHD